MPLDLLPRLLEVRAGEPYRIWLRYADGVEGEVDLAHLVGKGIFAAWKDRTFFEGVHVGPLGGVDWGQRVDLCADDLYLRLTGSRPLG